MLLSHMQPGSGPVIPDPRVEGAPTSSSSLTVKLRGQVLAEPQLGHSLCSGPSLWLQPWPEANPPAHQINPAPWCLPIIPIGSMPGGLPGIERSPGVVLVPGVGASFLGVGVLDLRPGVEDLSF